jgi:hypothetical protein
MRKRKKYGKEIRYPSADLWENKRKRADFEQLIFIRDFLKEQGIPFWLHGGWAIEVLSGAEFPHEDVDLFVEECYQDKLKNALGERLLLEFPNRFVCAIGKSRVDIAFMQRDRSVFVIYHPKIIWIFPTDAFAESHTAYRGEEIPVVPLYISYMEQTQKMWQKAAFVEKARKRAVLLDKVLSADEKAKSRKWWPLRHTRWNLIKLKLGLVQRALNRTGS